MSRRVAKRKSCHFDKVKEASAAQHAPRARTPKMQPARAVSEAAAPSGIFDWLLEGCVCCAGSRRGVGGAEDDEPEPLIPAVPRGAAAPARSPVRQPRLDPELCLVRADERDAMDALAAELAPEIRGLTPWDDVVGEICLLRFYRGHGTVQAAAQAYRKMLEWRIENAADKLRAAVAELPWAMDAVPGIDKISRVFPLDIAAGTSPNGHLVWLERNGRLDVGNFKALSNAEFQSTWGGLMEMRTRHLDDLSKAQQQLVKVVQVRDLRGFSASLYLSLVSSGVMGRLQSIILGSMAAHPESLHTVVMLNMPGAFRSVWALMQPLLNDKMKKKFNFLSYPHDSRALYEIVGADALLSLAKLAAPSLPCPGAASAKVAAEDFVELALRVPAGREVRWSFSSSAELEFSVLSVPENASQGAEALHVVAARSGATGEGSHNSAHDAVCVFRWLHPGNAWSSSRGLDYNVELV